MVIYAPRADSGETDARLRRHSAWRSAAEHRGLAVLLWTALPVEIATAANLVLRVGSVDSAGGGAIGVGGAFAAMSLAFAVAVIPAGVLVDRTPARRTFAVALALRALPMLLGGMFALWFGLTTTMVVALAVVDGLAMALLKPSWQHFQASLLPPAAVRDGAVLDAWIYQAGILLGALGGGLCVAADHIGVALLACAAGFIPLLTALAAGLGAGLRPPIPGADPVRALRGAWAALRGTPRLWHATRADVLLQLVIPVEVLVSAVLVAISAVDLLWLIGLAAGVGGVAGVCLVTWACNRMCPARLLRWTAWALVAVLAVEATALAGGPQVPTLPWLVGACVMVAVGGAAAATICAMTSAIVQAEAPAHVRGGVTGLVQAPKYLAMFVSTLAVGVAVDWFGPAQAVVGVAVGLLMALLALGGFRGLANDGP